MYRPVRPLSRIFGPLRPVRPGSRAEVQAPRPALVPETTPRATPNATARARARGWPRRDRLLRIDRVPYLPAPQPGYRTGRSDRPAPSPARTLRRRAGTARPREP